jgi:hypothetical protein
MSNLGLVKVKVPYGVWGTLFNIIIECAFNNYIFCYYCGHAKPFLLF